MKELNELLLIALKAAVAEEHPDLVDSITLDTNLFAVVDSFALVSVLLESESAIEEQFGRYIPLADETIFDASKSPFLLWNRWIDYVQGKINA